MKPINSERKQQIIAAVGRVAVLLGGGSSERVISLESGQAVLDSLLRQGVNASPVDTQHEVIPRLQELNPDFAVNMLHGKGGEDGVIQGVLQTLGIPCTGSGVLASALAMDKVRSKLLWRQLGLATAEFEMLTSDSDWRGVLEALGPVVVKPVQGGSSIGIAIVRDAAALERQYGLARRHDSRVMAERYIAGEEFTVGVLGERLLPVIRLQVGREFYDYEAKYEDAKTRFICPAPLPEARLNELNRLVRGAYRSLGCSGLARVDVMQDGDGGFHLLEVNTVPGMTSHSLVPAAAKEAGMDFDELVLRLLDEALHQDDDPPS